MCNNPAIHSASSIEAALSPSAEAFAENLLVTLNNAATALMLSIGHRTGLFEAMAAGDALTSAGWADKCGLQERYVREWLAGMAVAGIVGLDTASQRYHLPADHALFLGRGAPGGNFAAMMQWIGVLAPVESQIVDCFRHGGGVPYEAYPRFHDVMAEDSAATIDTDATITLVPGLRQRLEAGIDVLDVGCGLGRAIRKLAAEFPKSRFTGYDLGIDAIGAAHEAVRAQKLQNVRFHALDATKIKDVSAFDLIFTFDAVHDQPHPADVLANINRALRPDGVYIMQDIWAETPVSDNMDHPMGAFLYTISTMHCMTVSLAQGGIGLGAAWGEQLARAMIDEAGFSACDMHKLPHDMQNAYYICRP